MSITSLEILSPREVPLGGLRAMTVRRTLPQRQRSLVGPWCFCDHYGPDDVSVRQPMVVPPHPHTGLATVSWLFSGEVEHRDSAGHHAMVRPGELNLMTAGRGISHSEYSTAASTILHGCQLWLALPDAARDGAPGFEHFAPEPVRGSGWEARVFLGSLPDSTSLVRAHGPAVGAEIRLSAGSRLELPVDADFEHALLLDSGDLSVDRAPVEVHDLGYVGPGRNALTLSSSGGALLMLIGGTPFGEEIVMWWNFVGRSHEEVADYRRQWQHLLATGSDDRFALAADDPMGALDAPALPNARLRPRR